MTERNATYAHNIRTAGEDTEKDHFYPTPPEATAALLRLETFHPAVWEPACGDGAISDVLEATGYDVTSTDLVDRHYGEARVDFLMEHRLLAPHIITNPPFKLAEEFVLHGLGLGATKIAMLLRLAWLEGIDRKALFASTPIARVHVSSRRLKMRRAGTDGGKGGSSMVAFAWFVWEVGHVGPPILNWFDWKDE